MSEGSLKSVLVVEDEPGFAELIARILRQRGFQVQTACDGEEALKAVVTSPPALITLDLQMPKKTGLLFYRQMKSLSACRDIPVIVITGLTRGDRDAKTIIRSFLETDHLPQPDAYLEKPFDNKQLVELASSFTKA